MLAIMVIDGDCVGDDFKDEYNVGQLPEDQKFMDPDDGDGHDDEYEIL